MTWKIALMLQLKEAFLPLFTVIYVNSFYNIEIDKNNCKMIFT